MHTRLPNGDIVYHQCYSCIVEPQNGIGGIYVGNLEASQNPQTLRKNGIKAILTAAKGIELTHSKTNVPYYLMIPGEDREDFDMMRYFPQAINFIRNALTTTNIMVHCLAGVSRSVCFVMAYFIKCKGMSYEEAFCIMKQKRSLIHPNKGFIEQLRKYEQLLKKQKLFLDNPQQTVNNSTFYHYGQISDMQEERQKKQVQNRKKIDQQANKLLGNLNQYASFIQSKIEKRKTEIDLPNFQNWKDQQHFQYLEAVNKSASKLNKSYSKKIKSLASYKQERQKQVPKTPGKIIRNLQKQKMKTPEKGKEKEKCFATPQMKPKAIVSFSQKREKGEYDNLRQLSANELAKELDNKMNELREKYAKVGIFGSNSEKKNPQSSDQKQDIKVTKFSFLDEDQIIQRQKCNRYEPISEEFYGKNTFHNISQNPPPPRRRAENRRIFKQNSFL